MFKLDKEDKIILFLGISQWVLFIIIFIYTLNVRDFRLVYLFNNPNIFDKKNIVVFIIIIGLIELFIIGSTTYFKKKIKKYINLIGLLVNVTLLILLFLNIL